MSEQDQQQNLLSKNQGTPTGHEAVRETVDAALSELHFAMPGIVVNYYPADDTADIQPAFQRQFVVDSKPTPYKPIPKVPIIYLGPAQGWLHYPLAQGDQVLLIFNERNIDTYWTQGTQAAPPDQRTCHLTDAVAIAGFRARPQKIVLKGDPTSMELAFGTAWLEITQTGKFKIKNGAADLKSIESDTVSMVQNATAPPGGGPLIFTFPNPASVNAEINNLFQ